MNKSELMTIISDVLLSNTKLKEEKIEELADLASDAIRLNIADEQGESLETVSGADALPWYSDDIDELDEVEF